ncbi:uncharacterized protein LOC131428957 [Malaya genurostris]|uniref:uncharacterized protein LOC131428957 n=1 Tax=Malaya genurostris TaxID=325434 RepID=UPI0026F3AB44|nr:uncharacterized protein LOC131428957 [Malaya genurostris]
MRNADETMQLILQRTTSALKLISTLTDTMQVFCRMYSNSYARPCDNHRFALRDQVGSERSINDSAPFLKRLDDLQLNLTNLFESILDDKNKRPRTSSTGRPSLAQPDKIQKVDVPVFNDSISNIIVPLVSETIETDIPTTIAADELMPIDIATSTVDIGTVPPSPPLTATTNICNTSTAPCPPLTSSTLPPVLPTTHSNRPNFLPLPTATMTPVITANQHQSTTTAITVTTTNYIQPAGTTNTTASFGNACTSTASRPFIPIHGDNGSNDIGYTARNNQTTPILQHIIPAQSNLNVTPANTAQVPMKISKQPKVSVLSNIPYVGPIQFKLTPNSNNQINNNLAPPPLPTRNTSSLANRQITALQVALPTRPILSTNSNRNWYYLTKFLPSESEDNIINYVQYQTNCDRSQILCFKLVSQYQDRPLSFISFKLSVPEAFEHEITAPTFWPRVPLGIPHH